MLALAQGQRTDAQSTNDGTLTDSRSRYCSTGPPTAPTPFATPASRSTASVEANRPLFHRASPRLCRCCTVDDEA
eukprot:6637936-Prymnesium_polylepis.1